MTILRLFWLCLLLATLIIPSANAAQACPAREASGQAAFQNLADQGYSAYSQGHYEDATTCFRQALVLKPDRLDLSEQLAYALRRSFKNVEARAQFEQVWQSTSPDRKPRIAREIEALSRPLRASGYFVHRDSAIPSDALAAAGGSLTQSQAGVEVAWRPPHIGYRDGRTFEAFSRLLWGLDGSSLRFRDETYQAGIGVKYKPLATQNIVLAAERLISVGDQARDDWMLRSAYSWDKGYGLQPGKDHWPFMTFYVDGALIRPTNPDIFAASDIRTGYSFLISGNQAPLLIATPHIVTTGVVQKDPAGTTTLLEAGPGVSVKLWLQNGAHGAVRSSLDLILQYRVKLAGNSAGKSGFTITLAADF